MTFWSEKESRFLKSPYTVTVRMSSKIRLAAGIVFTLAMLEHVLFLTNSAYSQYVTIKTCNCTDEFTLSYFLTHQFAFIFEKIPLNLPYGMFVEIYNLCLTLSWNYMELFVMMVSIGLFTRFNQINARIRELDMKVRELNCEMIDVFQNFQTLCRRPTKWFGSAFDLTMFCFASSSSESIMNFDFLSCCQILTISTSSVSNFSTSIRKQRFCSRWMMFVLKNALNFSFFRSLPHIISYVYFWVSLIYLFGRTLTAQFLAALIHDTSSHPLDSLKNAQHCVEVTRFVGTKRELLL